MIKMPNEKDLKKNATVFDSYRRCSSILLIRQTHKNFNLILYGSNLGKKKHGNKSATLLNDVYAVYA